MEWAERHCARVAITGRAGERLSKLAGVDRATFYAANERRNLNARFNGKLGKGDRFDKAEAKMKSLSLEWPATADHFSRFVLLGAAVSEAFGFKYRPLAVHVRTNPDREYLLFPHPSGISR